MRIMRLTKKKEKIVEKCWKERGRTIFGVWIKQGYPPGFVGDKYP